MVEEQHKKFKVDFNKHENKMILEALKRAGK
jgi:hypothetical protein